MPAEKPVMALWDTSRLHLHLGTVKRTHGGHLQGVTHRHGVCGWVDTWPWQPFTGRQPVLIQQYPHGRDGGQGRIEANPLQKQGAGRAEQSWRGGGASRPALLLPDHTPSSSHLRRERGPSLRHTALCSLHRHPVAASEWPTSQLDRGLPTGYQECPP